MIWSVSTFTRSSGATRPRCVRKGFMGRTSLSSSLGSLEFPVPNIREVPRNRRRRRHHGTDEMCPPTPTLPPFEIAVAGRGATLARLQNVGIHAQTHRASRLAPLESRVQKNPVQPFLFCRPLHRLRSRNHHGPYLRAHMMSSCHARCRPQIFNARVRARTDKHTVDADVFNAFSRIQPHVLQCEFSGAPVGVLQTPNL